MNIQRRREKRDVTRNYVDGASRRSASSRSQCAQDNVRRSPTLTSQHSNRKFRAGPRRYSGFVNCRWGSSEVGGSMRSEFAQESLVPETYTTAGAKFSAHPLSSSIHLPPPSPSLPAALPPSVSYPPSLPSSRPRLT